MATKAKQPTLTEFVEWCKQQVDLSELSQLTSSFGLTDDNTETIVAALENNPDFIYQFGALVRENLAKDKSYFDESRAAGSLTADHWLDAAKASAKPRLARATGSQPLQWWQIAISILGGAATTALGILGGGTGTTKTAEQIAAEKLAADKAAAGKQTFLYIVLAVVVIAVVVILWMSTKKK